MGRAPCCDKANVKKGPWSPEEDLKLKDYIEKNGTGGNWIALPQKAGLKRCGKSCRLRWLNYLRPNIKHGEFSDEEDRVICTLFATIGSRWSIIAAQLPGRTDNDIKNYWNTKLKKKLISMAPPPPPPCSTTTTHHKIKPPSTTAPLPLMPSYHRIISSSLAPSYDRDCTSFNNMLSSSDLWKYAIANSCLNSSLLQLQDCGISVMSGPAISRYCYPSSSRRKENMLMFGNSEASCSSDDCTSYNGTIKEIKQEDLVTLQSCCYDNNNNNMSSPTGLLEESKFMLMSYSNNDNSGFIGSTENVNPSWTDKAANGFYGETATLLEDHDVQDTKRQQQLMMISTPCTSDINYSSNNSFNFIEESKGAVEKNMYSNYYYY